MAISAVNIFTQKRYEDYAPQRETIQNSSVGLDGSQEPSELQTFINDCIANICGYKDADSMVDTTGLPKGRSLAGLSSKWIKGESSTGPSAKLNRLNSFDSTTDDKIDEGKASGVVEVQKLLEQAEKDLKTLKAELTQKQTELDQGYTMITDKNGNLKKKKLAKKNNNGYNKEEWQNAINELTAKVKSKEQLISNYKSKIEYLSS